MNLAPLLIEDLIRITNFAENKADELEKNKGLQFEASAYLIYYSVKSYYYKKGLLFYLYWKLNPNFNIKSFFKLDHVLFNYLLEETNKINGFDKKKVETNQI